MLEYSVPALGETAKGNLADIVVKNAEEVPHRVVVSRRVDGVWHDVTARELLADVDAVAKGLVASGVEPGDRVALMAGTRYEWTVVDLAVWSAGAIVVPVYETSSAEQVQWILGDSGARACVVEKPEHLAIVAALRGQLPDLAHVTCIEQGGIADLTAAGSGVADAEIVTRRASTGGEDLATIIYTSGTTGRPKGCELSHANFYAEVDGVVESMPEVFFDAGASTLLFLPLAHVFARAIEIGCLRARARLGHSSDTKNLLVDLAAFRPTFLLSVPRVFEKVFNSAQQKAHAGGKGKIFDAAAATAVAWSEALDDGRPALGLRLRHAVFDRLVYAKLRAALGGQVSYAISGGAPLGARLGHFFRGIGVTILEGYGLTETSAGATINLPHAHRVGTVGRPLPGTSLRIADDGEVLISGGVVFKGYYRNPAATEEAMADGRWFRTGDIGELDDDGYLRITGRKKELLVTAGGKNVAPAVLEDRLRAHLLVSQCMVVGDAQPYIACLVTLDAEALPGWLSLHGKPAGSVESLADDPDVRNEIQRAVDEANRAVSKAEAIKKFLILPVDFTEEGGQLTPSLKLKRNVVMKEFGSYVDALYS